MLTRAKDPCGRKNSVNEPEKINLMSNYKGDCILDSGFSFLAYKCVFSLFSTFLLFLCKEEHYYNFAVSGRLILSGKMPQNSGLK